MDTLNTDRQIVQQVISHYAQLRPSHGQIRLETVFDDKQDRYALMQVGWDRGRRVRGNLIYIVLRDGNVVIEYDGMEAGITQDLIDQGIPKQRLVLGFLDESAVTLSA